MSVLCKRLFQQCLAKLSVYGKLDIAGLCRDAMKKGKCKLMEPVMRVDVLTPEDHMGDVIGDLNSRRGMVRALCVSSQRDAMVTNA